MKGVKIFSVVFVIASLVLIGCQKEVSTFDEQQDVQKDVLQIKIHKNGYDSLIENPIEWGFSTYFFYSDDSEGPFYDVEDNVYMFDMAPIYEPTIGQGALSSIDSVYHVACDVSNGGNSCGRVWVDVNGVDKEGVYYKDMNERYYIDLSWKLR